MKMKKFMKRWMPLLLTLMVCVGTFWSSVVPVYASMGLYHGRDIPGPALV